MKKKTYIRIANPGSSFAIHYISIVILVKSYDTKTNLKFLNEFFGIGRRDEDVTLRRLNEPIIYRFINEGQQEVVIAFNIQ